MSDSQEKAITPSSLNFQAQTGQVIILLVFITLNAILISTYIFAHFFLLCPFLILRRQLIRLQLCRRALLLIKLPSLQLLVCIKHLRLEF